MSRNFMLLISALALLLAVPGLTACGQRPPASPSSTPSDPILSQSLEITTPPVPEGGSATLDGYLVGMSAGEINQGSQGTHSYEVSVAWGDPEPNLQCDIALSSSTAFEIDGSASSGSLEDSFAALEAYMSEPGEVPTVSVTYRYVGSESSGDGSQQDLFVATRVVVGAR